MSLNSKTDGYTLLVGAMISTICEDMRECYEELKKQQKPEKVKTIIRKIDVLKDILAHWCEYYNIEPEYILKKGVYEYVEKKQAGNHRRIR